MKKSPKFEQVSSERGPLLYSLRKFPLICRNVETEAIIRRLAEFMELCYSRAELHRVWHIVCHFNVLAQEEVCFWIGSFKFAPRIRLWHEGWHGLEKFGHRAELSFEHHSPGILCCAFQEVSLWSAICKDGRYSCCHCPCRRTITIGRCDFRTHW